MTRYCDNDTIYSVIIIIGGVNMLVILVVLGFIPFALGSFMNWFMMTYSNTLSPLALVGIVTLLIWAAIAFLVKPYIKQQRQLNSIQ